ncbi:MAG: hypothetical protein IKG96_04560 [Bacteroidaceae bacterium]|jgi:hypothetical protein|nr:hypothetical protein [Bacteroidaceae bacterium]
MFNFAAEIKKENNETYSKLLVVAMLRIQKVVRRLLRIQADAEWNTKRPVVLATGLFSF